MQYIFLHNDGLLYTELIEGNVKSRIIPTENKKTMIGQSVIGEGSHCMGHCYKIRYLERQKEMS